MIFKRILSSFLCLVIVSTTLPNIKSAQAQVNGVSIQSIATGGSPYSQVNNCPSVLPVGSSCDVNVTFSPTEEIFTSGELTINTNVGKKIISLSGTGVTDTQIPPQPAGNITYYSAPSGSDFLSSVITSETVKLLPTINGKVIDNGQRLVGNLTIGVVAKDGYGYVKQIPDGVSYRLLINGQPMSGTVLNTTTLENGTHHIAIQVLNRSGNNLTGSHVVVVVNNSGTPYISKKGQVVSEFDFKGRLNNNLAFARVDVGNSMPAPLGFNLAMHPVPSTDQERERLMAEKLWWVDGLNAQGTNLYQMSPMLVKNRLGDYYLTQWNTQDNSSSTFAVLSVAASPQFDGPRNIGTVSPYSTFIADTKVLSNGFTGWLGVDLTGRVMEMSMTGEVKTIYGPRSVSGIVQTDPTDTEDSNQAAFSYHTRVGASQVELKERLDKGEKEVVRGRDIFLALDLSVEGDNIWIADHHAGKILSLNRNSGDISTLYNIPSVSSVWKDKISNRLYAVAPNGIYVNGTFKASIPKAFWVRGIEGGKVYILDTNMAFWEYDPVTEKATKVSSDLSSNNPFVFFDIDTKGLIGPKNRIYYSMVNSFNSSTGVAWTDIGDWKYYRYLPGIVNDSQQAITDPFGHYIWGFTIHGNVSQFITTGISNTSWKLWTSHIGHIPTQEPKWRDNYGSFLNGRDLWWKGIKDQMLPLSNLWGSNGHGYIGLSIDDYRDLQTVGDIKTAIKPKLPAYLTDQQLTDISWFVLWNRSRKHFLPTTADNHTDHNFMAVSEGSYKNTSSLFETNFFTRVIDNLRNIVGRLSSQFAAVSYSGFNLEVNPSSISFGNTYVNSSRTNKITLTVSGIIDDNASVDTTAPSTPTNLQPSGVTTNSISLTWNQSTDNVGVTGYNIYRNGMKVNSVSTNSYTDSALQVSTNYIYTVSAVDAAGNESAKSGSVSVSTLANPLDTTAPSTPAGLSLSSLSTDSVTFGWNQSTDNVGVTGYKIYRNNQLLKSVSASPLSYTDTSLTPDTTYTYAVSAVDLAGNESAKSTTLSVTTNKLADSSFSILKQEVSSIQNDSAIINVSLSEVGYVTVDYGRKTNDLNSKVESLSEKAEHSLSLTSLSNGTIYYRVTATNSEGDKEVSDVMSFQISKTSNNKGGGGGGSSKSDRSTLEPASVDSSFTTYTTSDFGTFDRNIVIGSEGEDVKRLQQLLNSDPDTQIAVTGDGAKGNETTYFGSLTAMAVGKFQLKHGILKSVNDEGYGQLGPMTRAKINEMSGNTTVNVNNDNRITLQAQINKLLEAVRMLQQQLAQKQGFSTGTPSTIPSGFQNTFTRNLAYGSEGEDVKRLQQLLNSDPDTQIAVTGDGAPGYETTFFGSGTEEAVKRFQIKHGIVYSGTPETTGYGAFGPSTRAVAEQL